MLVVRHPDGQVQLLRIPFQVADGCRILRAVPVAAQLVIVRQGEFHGVAPLRVVQDAVGGHGLPGSPLHRRQEAEFLGLDGFGAVIVHGHHLHHISIRTPGGPAEVQRLAAARLHIVGQLAQQLRRIGGHIVELHGAGLPAAGGKVVHRHGHGPIRIVLGAFQVGGDHIGPQLLDGHRQDLAAIDLAVVADGPQGNGIVAGLGARRNLNRNPVHGCLGRRREGAAGGGPARGQTQLIGAGQLRSLGIAVYSNLGNAAGGNRVLAVRLKAGLVQRQVLRKVTGQVHRQIGQGNRHVLAGSAVFVAEQVGHQNGAGLGRQRHRLVGTLGKQHQQILPGAGFVGKAEGVDGAVQLGLARVGIAVNHGSEGADGRVAGLGREGHRGALPAVDQAEVIFGVAPVHAVVLEVVPEELVDLVGIGHGIHQGADAVTGRHALGDGGTVVGGGPAHFGNPDGQRLQIPGFKFSRHNGHVVIDSALRFPGMGVGVQHHGVHGFIRAGVVQHVADEFGIGVGNGYAQDVGVGIGLPHGLAGRHQQLGIGGAAPVLRRHAAEADVPFVPDLKILHLAAVTVHQRGAVVGKGGDGFVRGGCAAAVKLVAVVQNQQRLDVVGHRLVDEPVISTEIVNALLLFHAAPVDFVPEEADAALVHQGQIDGRIALALAVVGAGAQPVQLGTGADPAEGELRPAALLAVLGQNLNVQAVNAVGSDVAQERQLHPVGARLGQMLLPAAAGENQPVIVLHPVIDGVGIVAVVVTGQLQRHIDGLAAEENVAGMGGLNRRLDGFGPFGLPELHLADQDLTGAHAGTGHKQAQAEIALAHMIVGHNGLIQHEGVRFPGLGAFQLDQVAPDLGVLRRPVVQAEMAAFAVVVGHIHQDVISLAIQITVGHIAEQEEVILVPVRFGRQGPVAPSVQFAGLWTVVPGAVAASPHAQAVKHRIGAQIGHHIVKVRRIDLLSRDLAEVHRRSAHTVAFHKQSHTEIALPAEERAAHGRVAHHEPMGFPSVGASQADKVRPHRRVRTRLRIGQAEMAAFAVEIGHIHQHAVVACRNIVINHIGKEVEVIRLGLELQIAHAIQLTGGRILIPAAVATDPDRQAVINRVGTKLCADHLPLRQCHLNLADFHFRLAHSVTGHIQAKTEIHVPAHAAVFQAGIRQDKRMGLPAAAVLQLHKVAPVFNGGLAAVVDAEKALAAVKVGHLHGNPVASVIEEIIIHVAVHKEAVRILGALGRQGPVTHAVQFAGGRIFVPRAVAADLQRQAVKDRRGTQRGLHGRAGRGAGFQPEGNLADHHRCCAHARAFLHIHHEKAHPEIGPVPEAVVQQGAVQHELMGFPGVGAGELHRVGPVLVLGLSVERGAEKAALAVKISNLQHGVMIAAVGYLVVHIAEQIEAVLLVVGFRFQHPIAHTVLFAGRRRLVPCCVAPHAKGQSVKNRGLPKGRADSCRLLLAVFIRLCINNRNR